LIISLSSSFTLQNSFELYLIFIKIILNLDYSRTAFFINIGCVLILNEVELKNIDYFEYSESFIIVYGELCISRSHFENFYFNNNMLISSMGSYIEIISSYFANLSTTSNGAAINHVKEGGLVINSSSFISCSGYISGAIYYELEEKGSLYLYEDVYFEKCNAVSDGNRGSGLYLKIINGDEDYKFISVNLISDMDNILIEFPNLFVSVNDIECFKSKYEGYELKYNNSNLLGFDYETSVIFPLIYFLKNYENLEIYISLDGFDTSWCGYDILPCKSLSYGLDHFVNTPSSRTILIISHNFYSCIFIDDITLRSAFEYQIPVIVNESTYLSVDPLIKCEGIVNIIKIKFLLSIENNFITSSLFVCETNFSSLKFVMCSFESTNPEVVVCIFSSLIIIVGESIELDSCSFIGIENSGSSGGVLNAVVENLCIKNCIFENISVSSSRMSGGAIYAKIKSGGVLEISGNLTSEINDGLTLFANCTAGEYFNGEYDGSGGGIFLTFESPLILSPLTFSFSCIEFNLCDAGFG
jgi:hypothetical protein